MIPKIIHYCWFGGKPLSDKVKFYIESWKTNCPDYEIVEWNENNFDVNENSYCREAYEARKWAFVTDYVRLKVLYEYGGIYMDTDVEVCKNMDPLLCYDAVFGYETKTSISTGTIASCRESECIKYLLMYYDDRHFIKEDGRCDTTTNVKTVTRLIEDKYGIKIDGKIKNVNNMVLLPFDYLCAKSWRTGEIVKTENTYSIHHYSASWLSDDSKKERKEIIRLYNNLSWIPISDVRIKLATVVILYKMYGARDLLVKMIDKLL